MAIREKKNKDGTTSFYITVYEGYKIDRTGYESQNRKYKTFKQPVGMSLRRARQIAREIEIELPKDISSKIEGDKFFITAYGICPRFRLKYLHEQVIIALTLLNLKEHFLYYLVPLLEEVIKEVKGK